MAIYEQLKDIFWEMQCKDDIGVKMGDSMRLVPLEDKKKIVELLQEMKGFTQKSIDFEVASK